MTNAYILYTNFSPRGSKLDHEEFILTIARSMIQEGLRTSTINTPHVRTESLIQNEFTGAFSQGNSQERRDKKKTE